MDGLNLKISEGLIGKYFEQDSYGSLIPRADLLRMGETKAEVERQLSSDTGLYKRLTEKYYQTDVEFTDNPLGNTPVLGAGLKLFGPRVLKGKSFGVRVGLQTKADPEVTRALNKRQGKIERFQRELMTLHSELKPADDDPKLKLLWDVEKDQMMTGGGFDNNQIGGVHLSGLNFIIHGNQPFSYRDTVVSKLVVEGALWLKDQLKASGLREGSIVPDGATKVRFDQDTDGMIGWPVYAKANAPLSDELATRLLLLTSIDTRQFVNAGTRDKYSKQMYKYRTIDALAYILDRLVIKGDEFASVVTLLARIQKHGWKEEGDKLVAKPGKTRSVYPNAAIPGMIEAMIMAPFMRAIKEARSLFMPSLQDKPTRVDMISRLIREGNLKDYDFLAADWSKYDATVKGSILATIMHIAVRPFINARYTTWLDCAIYALTYKYIMLDEALCRINGAEYALAAGTGQNFEESGFVFFGMVDGLISGAKFTHGGGSMYGEVLIHYVLPKLLGYEPVPGPQAGDDTLLGIPKSMIDLTSSEATYEPIERIAKEQLGLDMNKSKQIFHQAEGEVVKVFLQENYHLATDVWGVGSIFRPLSALFTAERDKGLTVSLQMMAEIARMNQGVDSPFVMQAIEFWLEREQFLLAMFKEYGVSALDLIIQATGMSIEQIAQGIDVGSFSWGISMDELKSGSIPIVPLIAEVAAKMQPKLSIAKALESLRVKDGESNVLEIDDPTFDLD